MPSREVLLSETFVQLADTLVDDFDIVELLTVLADRSVQLLDAAAAGILLVDQRGVLQVVAASTEQARLLELFQLQNHEGPCLDCFSSGRAVVNQTLADGNRLAAVCARGAGRRVPVGPGAAIASARERHRRPEPVHGGQRPDL